MNAAPTTALPAVHPTYARMLCLTLLGLGVDVEAVLRQAGLPDWDQLASADVVIDQPLVNRLVKAAVDTSGCPWLGLEVGASVQVSAHGPLGYAVGSSRHLAQALQTVARYGSLRYGAVQYEYQAVPSGGVIRLVEVVDLGESREFVLCMVFATLMRLMEAVVGRPHHPAVVAFPFPEPPWRDRLERLCRGRLLFDQPGLSVQLDQTTLDLPCVTADPQAHATAVAQCEQLARQMGAGPLTRQVLDALNEAEGAYPSLSDLASDLGLSERTLMRHLKLEGSRFQAMLDGVRQQRAVWLLTHSTATVEDIATRLGFEDTSNFSRTFRRWFGKLPSEVRRGASVSTTGATS